MKVVDLAAERRRRGCRAEMIVLTVCFVATCVGLAAAFYWQLQ